MGDLEPKIPLWSDFDKTAVAGPTTLIRRMRKFPLGPMVGFNEFIDGTINGGLDFRGVISRRPDIAQRRRVMLRSIADNDLRVLTDVELVLTGNEDKKGAFVVDQARKSGTAVLLDDKPHEVGESLAGALRLNHAVERYMLSRIPGRVITPVRVVLGAVNHRKTFDNINELIEKIGGGFNTVIDSRERVTFYNPDYSLDVFHLPDYSAEAGYEFATTVLMGTPPDIQ